MSQSLSKLSEMLESLNNRISALEKANPNKFKPTDNRRFHLKGFRATMSIKGIDPILYPKIFPLSLDQVFQKWFFYLDEKDTATWEDIAHSFITRLLPKNRNHLRYLGLESFDKVCHIGIEVEDGLLKENAKNNKDGVHSSYVNTIETNQQRPKRKRRQYTPFGMSQEQAFGYLTAEGVLEPIRPTLDHVPHRRTKWWNPNKYCRYHRGNGHSTEKCFKLKDRIQDSVVNGSFHISSGDKKPNIQTNPLSVLLIDDEECSFDPTSYITLKTGRKRREFTPLRMTYTQAFDRLKSKGAITLVGPTPGPPIDRRSHNWDTKKYC
ncbi:Semaphorin-3ab [Bienertia sinuspersici]